MEPIYSRTVPPCNYIRTSDFSLSDLSIYVDSMETISRIERERHERRQRRRNNKLKIKSVVEVHPAPRTINNNEDSSEEEQHQTKPCPITKQQLRMKLFGSNTKLSPMMVASSSDENYFSGASESSEGKNDQHQQQQQQQQKNFMDSTDGIATLPPDSGTESESGNFKLRPRSFAMTNPKYRSTRARIIGLVLKREYANGGSLDELEQQERRERVLEGLLRDKKNKTKNTKKCESLRLPKDTTTISPRTLLPCKIQKQPSAEMRFIDKALRYLTL